MVCDDDDHHDSSGGCGGSGGSNRREYSRAGSFVVDNNAQDPQYAPSGLCGTCYDTLDNNSSLLQTPITRKFMSYRLHEKKNSRPRNTFVITASMIRINKAATLNDGA
ncbi:hypothetical protein HZH68_011640 [Vespula germanica]|uniref:Uncharacterized protein n=2 Tax=Vespula TaxID=7451 RepID=A0A834JJS6_VESGE|nr:hypothetical protein HZH68_011640 [Vespula germanica]KAF7412790.1 hypothetical protein H0235_012641 [Vespula pensylvanica]